MKNLLVGMLSALTIFSLSGCGGGGGGGTTPTTPSNELADEYQGFAKLGSLSGATVKIYKINSDGTKEIKWIETTIDSRDLATSGAFNSHFKDFGYPSAYYLYEVSGGVDIDSDNDGIVDTNPKTNTGTMRAIVYSDDFKSYLDNELKITLLSEIVYQRVEDAISNDNFHLSTYLDNEAKYVLEKDINLDGKIDYDDVLSFNPVTDADKVTQSFKDTNYDSYTNLLRYNSLDINPVTNLNISPTVIGVNNDSYSYSNLHNIAFSNDFTELYTNIDYSGTIGAFGIFDLINNTKTFVEHSGVAYNNLGITINSNDTKAYFISSFKQVVIIDLLTKSLDRYITFNEDTTINSNLILGNNKAFVSTNKGLAQIDLSDYSISYLDTNISNQLEMSKDGKSIYGVAIADNKIGIYNISSNTTELLNIELGCCDTLNKIKVSNDENTIYATSDYGGLMIYNKITNETKEIKLLYAGENILINSDETKAYIAVGSNSDLGDIAVVDLNTTYVSYLMPYFRTLSDISIKLGKDDNYLYMNSMSAERVSKFDVSSLN